MDALRYEPEVNSFSEVSDTFRDLLRQLNARIERINENFGV